jgi:hypothetical protein
MRWKGVFTSIPTIGEDARKQAFDERVDVLFGRERHLEVDLRELGLAVGAQVFVAEAARDLHVLLEAGDHQQLLEELRRLRESVELTVVHARRHQVVARSFRRRLGENRRLHVQKALLVEIRAHGMSDVVAQDHVALQLGAAQVEVAVLEPRFLGDVDPAVDRERQRFAARQDDGALGADFDLAGRQIGIHRRGVARQDRALHLDDPFGAHRVENLLGRRVIVRLRHHLRHAAAIPQVEEQNAAVIAALLHPGLQENSRTDVLAGESARSDALHDFTSGKQQKQKKKTKAKASGKEPDRSVRWRAARDRRWSAR